MRLPGVWIVAAFGAGIAFSLERPCGWKLWLVLGAACLAAAGIATWRGRLAAGWMAALAAWLAIGGLAASLERASAPRDHVSRLISLGRLDISEPHRWRGRLREDPMELPWGWRYEMDLEQVETAGGTMPLRGGLRMNLYHGPHAAGVPEGLRAGDRVEALLKARPPRNFLDPGAFDVRGYLARQGVDLTGSLRSGELLQRLGSPRPTASQFLARARGDLLARLNALFPGQPKRAAVLRAMLLGDRSFIDSTIVTVFQKTAAYHVLVLAGLHVGALAAFLLWVCRRLRFPPVMASLVAIAALAAYAGIVQDRPPILRATLMAAFYLSARIFFRRVDLLHTVALAALALLLWKPSSLADPSFQLSFLAAGVIASLAVPWMDRCTAPYSAGLRHLGDMTHDSAHPPKVVQFRIELRAAANHLAARIPSRLAKRADWLAIAPVRTGLILLDVVLLSAVIQWGMMPLLARDFHRVSLAGPASNIPAVLLTGLIVPLGFLTLVMTFVWAPLALAMARVLGALASALIAIMQWFSAIPRASYRIPGPPAWLLVSFLVLLACLAAAARTAALQRRALAARRRMPEVIAPREWAAAAALAVLTFLVASYPFPPKIAPGRLAVTVLDVGQGDSIFAAFPDGRTMLIDGGGLPGSQWEGRFRAGTDVGEEAVSPFLWSLGLKRLDVVVLTHAHRDHLGGLFSVLANFRIGQLWVGRDVEAPAYRALLAEARSRGASILHWTEGGRFAWDGVQGEVLWPPDRGPVEAASNDDSLVLRLSDGRERLLLAGDIQQPVEETLVADRAPLSAAFLKAPHHGSRTSSSADFLAAVAPRIAVISVGATNPFGHPSQSVVERYEQDGIQLFRTDRDGAVTLETDGRMMSVSSYVGGNLQ